MKNKTNYEQIKYPHQISLSSMQLVLKSFLFFTFSHELEIVILQCKEKSYISGSLLKGYEMV